MTAHSKRTQSGIRLMLQASFSFSIMALCVKFASRDIPSLEIVFFRSLIGCIMLLPIMFRKGVSLLGRERRVMVLRGLSGFIALSLFFYTLGHLPLGTAVILNYTGPIFATMLAIFFLKERPGGLLIAMLLISFLGVFLLVEGRFTSWNFHVFTGLLSAVFAAIAYVSIRAIRNRESPLTVIFYFTAISTVGSLFYLPYGFRWPDLQTWIELAGVGVGAFYGQLWMTMALRRAPASVTSPFFYLTPLLTFFYDVIFFGEKMTPISVTGAVLIIAGGSLVSYFETKLRKNIPPDKARCAPG